MMKACFKQIRVLAGVVGLGLATGLVCEAQNGAAAQPGQTQTQAVGITVKEIHPKPIVSPFALDGGGESKPSLVFLAPEQMSEHDRDLAEGNQTEIERRAALQGFGMGHNADEGPGKWGYEQAVCPAFPDHLILEYSRIDGPGDVTLFSAVIPRGEGHVRVIPVRRHGYSLWTPSSSNELTIHNFNHMVKESETKTLPPDWLTLGLCYTALAGGHVRAALVAHSREEETYPLYMPATLRLEYKKDGPQIWLVDETPDVKAMKWSLTFSRNGQLLKVKHATAVGAREKPVPGAAVDLSKIGN